MAGPRNNLDDVLRRLQQPATPALKTKAPQNQGSTSKAKFRPAVKSPPVAPSSSNDAVPAQRNASNTSFSTVGFGKTRPAPLHTASPFTPNGPLQPDTARHHPSEARHPVLSTSSPPSSDSPPSESNVPGKRPSPASLSVTFNPPPKRPRPSLEPEKENIFLPGDSTQILESQEKEDSGYISFADKGKGRDTTSWSYMNTITPASTHGSRMPRTEPRTSKANTSSPHNITTTAKADCSRRFEFDYSALLSMSMSDLQEHKGQLVDMRSRIMNLRPQLQTDVATVQSTFLLQKFDEILQDRLQCIDGCMHAERSGQIRQLPTTNWSVSTPADLNTCGDSLPQVSRPPCIQLLSTYDRSVSRTSTTLEEDEYPDVADFDNVADTRVVHESEDELWGQVDDVDHIDYTRPGLQVASSSYAIQANLSTIGRIDPCSEPATDLLLSPHYPELKRALHDVFGLRSFRPNQLEAIVAFMDGHDVFVLMPTGGGKSLCFQLPAVCKNNASNTVTVVIGPLLSLMQDQVVALESKGVDVVHFSGELGEHADKQMHQRLLSRGQKPCMVYISPEKLDHSQYFQRDLQQLYESKQLGGIVIDEAHCISTWGRSFRESYTRLQWLRDKFRGVPMMALTATANRQTVEDIVTKLGISGCKRFTMSFNRNIVDFIKTRFPSKTGIIYYNNKAKCDKLAEELRTKHGLQAASYHAELDRDTKSGLQRDWQLDKIRIIVATVAFGMGIDKSDVRFVIHFTMPGSLSSYYQETGRAGRDGKPSHCRLYYSPGDCIWPIKKARDEIKDEAAREDTIESVRRVIQYCQNDIDCRRVQVLGYFDERFDKANCQNGCDNCKNTSEVVQEDVTKNVHDLIAVVREAHGKGVTRAMMIEIYIGKLTSGNKTKGFDRFQSWALGSGVPKDRAERVFDHLYFLGVIDFETEPNASGWNSDYVKVGDKVDTFVSKNKRTVMNFRTTPTRIRRKEPIGTAVTNDTPGLDAATSRRRAKRTEGRRPEILDDPISLFASDDETDNAGNHTSRGAAPPTKLFGGDDRIDETKLMQECRNALQKKIQELQSQVDVNLSVLFDEEVLDMLSVTLPDDIIPCRTQLEMIDGFDYEQATEYIPGLLAICKRYKSLLDDMRARSTGIRPSIDQLQNQYEYRQPASSKPTSKRGPRS